MGILPYIHVFQGTLQRHVVNSHSGTDFDFYGSKIPTQTPCGPQFRGGTLVQDLFPQTCIGTFLVPCTTVW